MSFGSQSATLDPVKEVAAPEAKRPANRLGVIAAFFSIYVIWGSTYLAIRYAVAAIPPLYTAGFRHLIAGTILLLWALAKGQRPTWPQIKASLVIGFLFFLIGHGSLHWAETQIPSGLASLLIASEPIWVFLMTCAAEKRWRMNGYLLVGVALGLAGVGLLLGRDVWSHGQSGFLGAVACLVGAISWSAGIIYSRRSHLSGSPLLLSALSLLAGSGMLLASGTILGEQRGFSFVNVPRLAWLSLAYLIVFGSVIAFVAYLTLMGRIGADRSGYAGVAIPIVALGLSTFFEDLHWDVFMLAGILMCVMGNVLVLRRGTA